MPQAAPPRQDVFRNLVENLSDYAILLLDRNGVVTSWNRGGQHIIGYEPAEIIGSHVSRLFTEEAVSQQWPQKALELATRHGRMEDEGWRVRRDGSRFWASVVITSLQAGDEIIGFAKIIRDTTDAMRQVEKLHQSEQTFRLLVQNVKDYAIIMLDTEGHVGSWNEGAATINGYRSDEIVGRHFSAFYPPEDIANGKPARLLRIARTEGRVQEEGWRVRKDQSLFWAEVTLTAVYDQHRDLRGFAKVTRDLTERKRLEDIESSARRMNEFLAVLAHELRNPLAPISSAMSILARAPDDAQLVRAHVGIVTRQLRHLTHLVDDLLDVGRISAGRFVLRRAVIPIRDVIAAGIEASRPLLEEKRQRVVLGEDQPDFFVYGDLTRLAQVMTNLLLNASKFSPDDAPITITVELAGKMGRIRVADHGCGIPADLLTRIFDLFVQAERPGQTTAGGLGIGLSLCRSIVELHGGSVVASSAGVGSGSTFTVRLPAVNEIPTGKAAPAVSTGESRRILVVDDNRDAADSLGLLLQMSGHAVEIAYGGVMALQKVSTFAPDVAFIDLAMPDMDGIELLQELRNYSHLGKTRIYALTGFSENTTQARQVGFDGHLIKPVDIDALLQEIVEPRHG